MKIGLFIRRLFDVRGERSELWVDDPATIARSCPKRVAKPRVRVRPDGWVRHDGGLFPFALNTVVETGHAGGLIMRGRDAEYASFWHESWWRWQATSWRNNILFYRIVCIPAVPLSRHLPPRWGRA